MIQNRAASFLATIRPGIDQRRYSGAAEAEDEGGRAHRGGDAPVDAAAALVEPGSEDAGEEEAEERGRRGLVDRETPEQREERHHQHAADADRADEQANERGDRRKEQDGAQPAAKATSSLVRSTASFFRSA